MLQFLEYDCVYLHAFETASDFKMVLLKGRNNTTRHACANSILDEAFRGNTDPMRLATLSWNLN